MDAFLFIVSNTNICLGSFQLKDGSTGRRINQLFPNRAPCTDLSHSDSAQSVFLVANFQMQIQKLSAARYTHFVVTLN